MENAILLELQYLAPIRYYQCLAQYPCIWIDQHEHFSKGSFRNRCHIATASGLLRLSIPLQKGKHEQQAIRAVAIDNSSSWQLQHWRSLQTAYGKAPFWEDYSGAISSLYEKKYNWLWDASWEAQTRICGLLGLAPHLQLCPEYWAQAPENVLDFRQQIHPKTYHTSTEKLPVYEQLFQDRLAFLPNLSILDLLFCTGPEAGGLLKRNQ